MITDQNHTFQASRVGLKYERNECLHFQDLGSLFHEYAVILEP